MATVINVPLLHSPPSFQTNLIRSHPKRLTGVITRSSLKGRGQESLKSQVKISKDNRPTRLSARMASVDFTVKKPRFLSQLKDGLSKLGVPKGVVEFFFGWVVDDDDQNYPEIPEAKGSLSYLRTKPFFMFLHELYLAHGEIVRLRVGPKSFVIVSDPSIAKHILKDNPKAYSKGILAEILEFVMGKGLIPADGEIWRARRRAIVPALHLKMESMFSLVTLDIIGKAVFNYDFDSLKNDTGIVEAVYTALREAELRSVEPIPLWDIPIWKDISPRQRKVSKALKLINETLDNLIYQHARCSANLFKELQRMVEEEEAEFNEDYVNDQDPSILRFPLASGDDVSSNQLRDDLMTLLIAGHETTAVALTWTFYLLSQNPSAMSKVQEEVDSILGDRFPNLEDMKKLKYTTRVINESLRLYPQPTVLIRRALEDDMLGQYAIKRGEDVFISVWNVHHSPTLWENPDKFIPERWPIDGPNPNETNQNFSYMPFGGGPRKCVGDQFATYEAVVALSMLVRRFDFKMAVGAPEVNMTTGATIHTTDGLMMTVTRRVKPTAMSSG